MLFCFPVQRYHEFYATGLQNHILSQAVAFSDKKIYICIIGKCPIIKNMGTTLLLMMIIGSLPMSEYTAQDTVSRKIEELPVVTAAVDEQPAVANIGYGEIKRDQLTTSVSTIKVKRRDAIVYSNIYDYIQGRVAGVQVLKTGVGSARILIRGISTNSNATDPLILVDNVEMDDISTINPADVVSIDVLKDAGSCSIYGVRGANGVILITTRK